MELIDLVIENLGSYKYKVKVPDKETLLLYLNNNFLLTGQNDKLFCNAFLSESIQLLINSIFLYEEGYFECAFYSIRQASEVINSMIYLSYKDKATLNLWNDKKSFPYDKDIKIKLVKLSEGYNEIKSMLTDYFDYHKDLISKSHKIIHKQGFDTFYMSRYGGREKFNLSLADEMELFQQVLKYTIGMCTIVYILLDPLSLALCDDNVRYKINFQTLTQPIDINYFKDFLKMYDVIDKIKESKFYKDYINLFLDNQTMLPEVYAVVVENFWDIGKLENIETQKELLNTYEKFMLTILKANIQVSKFYYVGGLVFYFTSEESKFSRRVYGGNEFDSYLEDTSKFNIICSNVYISVVMMYDEPLYIECNEALTQSQIAELLSIEKEAAENYEKLKIIEGEICNLMKIL